MIGCVVTSVNTIAQYDRLRGIAASEAPLQLHEVH